MKAWFRRQLQGRQRLAKFGFVAGFATVGVLFLVLAKAAVPAGGFEAEDGTLAGAVSLESDAGASGGQAVKFGSQTTATTASSVSQYGITWTFDRAYPVGQFANGDYWVVGPVSITGMSPAFTGTRNGWEANPNSGDHQGLDNRLDNWQASRVPSLPYTAAAGTSIVKAVSRSSNCGLDGGHFPCLDTAVVLTVLGSAPPNNGTQTFRPAFFGTDKTLYSTAQLKTSLLPALSPVAGAPTIAQLTRRYQRPQIDYISGWPGRYMHPSQNYSYIDNPTDIDDISEYGSELAHDADEAALRFMLNDSVAAKMPALVNYIQAGIDIYGMHKGGVKWFSDGGHGQGRKINVLFAALLLDDATMKSEISGAVYDTYGDDGETYVTTNAKTVAAMQAAGYAPVLFGKVCDSGMYELRQSSGLSSGSADCRDPIGMIDGGDAPGDGYQNCCLSQPMKGASLAARLLPGGKAAWNYDPYHQYVDRWVNFGAWALPDDWNTLGRSPARNFTALHGTAKDAGYYGSTFVNNMWTAYRSRAD